MKLRNRVLGVLLLAILSLGIIGCSNLNNSNSNQEQESGTDDKFVKAFEKSINNRWDEQNKLEKKAKSNEKYANEQYNGDTIQVLESEIDSLEKNVSDIKDKDLMEIAKNYIEGVKKQVEASKTTDFELVNKYMEESEKLRKPALISMVDVYGVKIKEEHQQTYKDFKEKATIINKENEAQVFAEKLGSEMKLEKTTGEFGDIEFTTIVENSSDINFKTLSYKVQYKDKDGIVIGDDYIFLENFESGSKQKVRLRPYEDGVENVVIIVDWFEVK